MTLSLPQYVKASSDPYITFSFLGPFLSTGKGWLSHFDDENIIWKNVVICTEATADQEGESAAGWAPVLDIGILLWGTQLVADACPGRQYMLAEVLESLSLMVGIWAEFLAPGLHSSSPNWCGRLGNKLANGRSFSHFLPPSLCVFLYNTKVKIYTLSPWVLLIITYYFLLLIF